MGKNTNSNRLHLFDLRSGLTFLVDTGASVSVLPKPKGLRANPLSFKLYAANQTIINVYKIEPRTVEFEKGKQITWQFYTAEVPYPILGGDILAKFKLLPDLSNKTLVNSSGVIFGRGVALPSKELAINLVEGSNAFDQLLDNYPSVIGIIEP